MPFTLAKKIDLKKNPEHQPNNTYLTVFTFSLSFIFFMFAIQGVLILYSTGGHLCYTLDDPFIHLSVSKEIARGGYGINTGEYSSPSSSIIWPFLLLPFSQTAYHQFVPLVINIFSMIGTIAVLAYLSNMVVEKKLTSSIYYKVSLTIFLALALNTLGLVWTGMEHSLQVFITLLMLWGVISLIEKHKPPITLQIALVIAPLIRYELLALSFLITLFLCFKGYWKKAIFIGIATVTPLLIASLLFIKMGLDPLPNSVMVKKGLDTHSIIGLSNLSQIPYRPSGLTFTFCSILLLSYLLTKNQSSLNKSLATIALGAMIAHLIIGSFNSALNRYEVYIYAFTLPTLLYITKDLINHFLYYLSPARLAVLLTLILCSIFPIYFNSSLLQPFHAARAIYLQQYQMRKLALTYGKNIAINDIGLCSYGNSAYALDLAGLAMKKEIREFKSTEPCWMKLLVNQSNAKLIMIYDSWFSNQIPSSWIKLGTLNLSKKEVAVGGKAVSIYVTSSEEAEAIHLLVKSWANNLPKGSYFKNS